MRGSGDPRTAPIPRDPIQLNHLLRRPNADAIGSPRRHSRMRLRNRLDMLAFRRGLRRAQTPAEIVLWGLLRGGRLGVRFRRQYAVGPYVLDFYCASARLAVELDGAVHADDAAVVRDQARDAWLAERSIRVLRFENAALRAHPDAVLSRIMAALEEPA